MQIDWRSLDRWLMGEAWTASRISNHLHTLCEEIGPRWSSSDGERRAIEYIRTQLQAAGLDEVATEEFELDTWTWDRAEAHLVDCSSSEDSRAIHILPFLRCPAVQVEAPLVDVGFGTPREVTLASERLSGAVAVMALAYEPFTAPIHLAHRLDQLTEAGAAAAVVVETKSGGRVEYHTGSDWRDPGPADPPLPTVATSREDGERLRRAAATGARLRLQVTSRCYAAPSANVAAVLAGERWPDEHLLLCAHHDTVFDTPGGNDNGSGVVTLLETARVLAQLRAETGVTPGRTIRFVTFGAEEQKMQGATAYVSRHYGPETPPRLAINLDELSTGRMKGVVLAFPHLRDLVQDQLDEMGDGLSCHVMAQLDASTDHFPFLRAGIDAAHLWRWRFAGRRADAEFHHEPADTPDKVDIRELKEYVGQLARLLLRLSHVPPEEWPANPVTPESVAERLIAEREQVVRVF